MSGLGRTIVAPETTPSPTWNLEQLRTAIDAAGVALWTWNVDTDAITMDDRAYDLWGIPKETLVTFEDLSAHVHPTDQGRVRAGFAATRAITGSYEIDFRITHRDDVRWISARGQGNDAGIVNAVMSGIFLDVTGRKQAEEASELLAGEMSHRVKNMLTIASSLTALTSRSATTAADMARDLTHRLTALGRAHDLVRPLPGQKEQGALLSDLISVLLAPYDDLGAFSGRVRVSVPKLGVGENTATTLALIVHELATNSLKYGALSVATGMLDVSSTPHGNDVIVVWTERGGPPVAAPVKSTGFGSKMLERSISRHLGGSILFDWSESGLIVTLRMNKERLAA